MVRRIRLSGVTKRNGTLGILRRDKKKYKSERREIWLFGRMAHNRRIVMNRE